MPTPSLASIARAALAVFVVGCSRPAPAARPPALVPAPAGYAARRLAGFTVFVRDAVLAHPAEAAAVLARVETSLEEVNARFGPLRAAVAGVRVWVEWTPSDPARRRGVAEFHRSRAWLAAHGYDPAKERDVEVNDARGFLAATAGAQPAALLHEFVHAYELLALGDADPAVAAAYDAARASGRYDAVARAGGGQERAYALADPREYFAELTEAYLAVNDFFPFVREQLRAHDPAGHALMERVWGPQPARPALPVRACDAAPLSAPAGVGTAVVVVNATPDPIALWWVAPDGERRWYAQVAPGAEDVRQTYEGHAWVALGPGGRCLGAFVGAAHVGRAAIDGAAAP